MRSCVTYTPLLLCYLASRLCALSAAVFFLIISSSSFHHRATSRAGKNYPSTFNNLQATRYDRTWDYETETLCVSSILAYFESESNTFVLYRNR